MKPSQVRPPRYWPHAWLGWFIPKWARRRWRIRLPQDRVCRSFEMSFGFDGRGFSRESETDPLFGTTINGDITPTTFQPQAWLFDQNEEGEEWKDA